MSLTFKYSFTNAQDFCARKGNKISLSYYWIISIYGSEVLIHMRLKRFCNLYQGSSLPISTHTYDILSFASVFRLTISQNFHCSFSQRIIKRYYYKNCVTRLTTDREVSSANMPGISTSFNSDSGLSRSRISSGLRLDLFGFEVSTGFNRTPLPFAINVQEKKCWPKFFC